MKQFTLFILFLLVFGCNPELTKFYAVPDFSLTDQSGQTVALNDLKGKVWVADFIFTNCGGTCPVMTEKMRKLMDELSADIHMVSFSVDPARDTPKALAAYAAEHGANSDRWVFLTGEKQVMVDICMKGFKLPLDEEGGTPAEPITHSTRFVLVDKQGEIRGYYAGIEEGEVKRLAADAKRLL